MLRLQDMTEKSSPSTKSIHAHSSSDITGLIEKSDPPLESSDHHSGSETTALEVYNSARLGSQQMKVEATAAQEGNHALQEYYVQFMLLWEQNQKRKHTQLMLLEEQNKKRKMMVRNWKLGGSR